MEGRVVKRLLVLLCFCGLVSVAVATPYLPFDGNVELRDDYQWDLNVSCWNTPIIRFYVYQGTSVFTNANQYGWVFKFAKDDSTLAMTSITGIGYTNGYVDCQASTNSFTIPFSRWYSVLLATNAAEKISWAKGQITANRSPEISATEALIVTTAINGDAYTFTGSFEGWPFILKSRGTNWGDMLYYNGTNWVCLTPSSSTTNFFLMSAGTNANPRWTYVPTTAEVGGMITTQGAHTVQIAYLSNRLDYAVTTNALQDTSIANLSSTTATHTTQITGLQTTNTAMAAASNSWTQGIVNLSSTTATHTAQIAGLQTSNTSFNASITNLNALTAKYGTNVANLSSTTATHTAQITGLQTTNGTHETEINAIQASTVSAGTGMTGGGAVTSSPTLNFSTTWGDARYLRSLTNTFSTLTIADETYLGPELISNGTFNTSAGWVMTNCAVWIGGGMYFGITGTLNQSNRLALITGGVYRVHVVYNPSGYYTNARFSVTMCGASNAVTPTAVPPSYQTNNFYLAGTNVNDFMLTGVVDPISGAFLIVTNISVKQVLGGPIFANDVYANDYYLDGTNLVTLMNTMGGTTNLNLITANHTATNYTASAGDGAAHVAGIDTAIGKITNAFWCDADNDMRLGGGESEGLPIGMVSGPRLEILPDANKDYPNTISIPWYTNRSGLSSAGGYNLVLHNASDHNAWVFSCYENDAFDVIAHDIQVQFWTLHGAGFRTLWTWQTNGTFNMRTNYLKNVLVDNATASNHPVNYQQLIAATNSIEGTTNANAISANHTATNYSTTLGDVRAHVAGIDTQLGVDATNMAARLPTATYNSLTNSIRATNDHFTAWGTGLNTSNGTFNTGIANLSSTTATHTTSIANLSSTTATHTTSIANLSATTATHTAQITGLQTSNGVWNTGIANLSATTATHTASIVNLSVTTATHTVEIAGLQTSNGVWNTGIANLSATTATHTAQIAGLQATNTFALTNLIPSSAQITNGIIAITGNTAWVTFPQSTITFGSAPTNTGYWIWRNPYTNWYRGIVVTNAAGFGTALSMQCNVWESGNDLPPADQDAVASYFSIPTVTTTTVPLQIAHYVDTAGLGDADNYITSMRCLGYAGSPVFQIGPASTNLNWGPITIPALPPRTESKNTITAYYFSFSYMIVKVGNVWTCWWKDHTFMLYGSLTPN